jgi:hypothetical protein
MRKSDYEKLVAQLSGLKPAEGTEEIADDAIVSAIQTHGQPVYQIAHDRGHAAGTGKKGAEATALQTRVETAERERDEAKAALETLKGKAPDGEKLKAEYTTELQKAQEKFTAKEAALKATLKSTRLAWAKADLRASLVSDFKVDKDYAAVLVEKPEVIDRITHTDDGTLEVLQRGKQIPFAPGDGQTSIGLLAAELREGVNPKFIVSDADSGAGAGNGNGAGGPKGFDFKKHGEKKKAEQDAKKPEAGYRERLGITTPTT